MKGETLCITFSKYEKVRMPEEFGQPPDANTKDFSGEEFQKFKRYYYLSYQLFFIIGI